MIPTLLTTRTRVPPRIRHLVSRARLVDALERELPDYKLVVLAAPAGYGKTTFLAEWARASRCRVVWLTIDDDDDLDRFFRYVLAAWEEAQPGLAASPLGLVLGGASPDRDAVLSAFLTTAAAAPDPTVFVLDDCHRIAQPAILSALTFVVDHLPPTTHVVLAGRTEPVLPLARYRARRELLELRAADLTFRPDETAAFLTRAMGLDLAADDVARLHAALEGWIAGLQLVALSIQRGLTAARQPAVSGRHRFIADYLRDDVLALLPAEVRQFLAETSVLDRLCGPLCDAVTGRSDGQEVLERLERENLFVVPLDDRREWFRFHRLFADVLLDELNRHHPEKIAELHRRAAEWYLAHDLPEPAFDHAVAADDPELVMRLGEHYFEVKLLCGEFTLLNRWLESLPQRWRADYPLVGLFQAGVALFTGDLDAGARHIDAVERSLSDATGADRSLYQARVNAVRCAVACFQNDLAQAEAYADLALRELPAGDHAFRTAIHHALGDTYRRNGRWQDARASYLKVLDLVDEPAYRVRSAHVFSALADLELRRGRLRESAAYWRKALAFVQERASWGSLPLPLIGWVYIRLGEILYEWNDLEAASVHVCQGLERAEWGGDVRAIAAGRLIAARLALAEGAVDVAEGHLERAEPSVGQGPLPEWSGRFERAQVELWLARNQLRTAVDWSAELLTGDAVHHPADGDERRLAVARILIRHGDEPSIERARELLDLVTRSAESDGRDGVKIEALTLLSLAAQKRGDLVAALTLLERALRLAEPEGYVRLFADLGPPMDRLLHEARSRQVMPDYVARLLAASGAVGDSAVAKSGALAEPLSPREHDVLRLMAAGLTNREIGSALAISPETVKKHTVSIYGKLGVGRRTEAAARARALDLLDA
jgi:LuxR family transcriptional regulator, maltose regulon positive regulatory protein